MTDDLRTRKQLRARIQARRADIDAFLAHARPRRNLLTNITIVCSSLAALFAAVPSAAGPDGMKKAADTFGLGGPAGAWRPLCIAAFVVALAAAVAANLHKSYDLPAHVATAEACNAELESLLATLDFDDMPLHEAVEHYQQSIHKIPFVKERGAAPAGRRRVSLAGRSAH
jgi:hypothetical protein